MTDPTPSFEKTYRRADDEMIGDHGWVAHLDYFDEEFGPVELIEETWQRVSVRTFWRFPNTFYDCDLGDCEEDAVAWRYIAAEWLQVCAGHNPVGNAPA